jgi:hypothetical protein
MITAQCPLQGNIIIPIFIHMRHYLFGNIFADMFDSVELNHRARISNRSYMVLLQSEKSSNVTVVFWEKNIFISGLNNRSIGRQVVDHLHHVIDRYNHIIEQLLEGEIPNIENDNHLGGLENVRDYLASVTVPEQYSIPVKIGKAEVVMEKKWTYLKTNDGPLSLIDKLLTIPGIFIHYDPLLSTEIRITTEKGGNITIHSGGKISSCSTGKCSPQTIDSIIAKIES